MNIFKMSSKDVRKEIKLFRKTYFGSKVFSASRTPLAVAVIFLLGMFSELVAMYLSVDEYSDNLFYAFSCCSFISFCFYAITYIMYYKFLMKYIESKNKE